MNKVLESLHKKKENSTCFDCYEKGTTFVNVTLGTFVCTRCAGLLRELSFTVKGLGVSIFKDKEVSTVEEMGNEKAWKVWLAKFREIKGVYPNPKDILEIQEHLREKYILKRFFKSEEFGFQDTTSFRSAEVKNSNKVINSETNSNNGSVNTADVKMFNEGDFKFENNIEVKPPSKFKKFSSAVISSNLKIDSNVPTNDVSVNVPLTTKKSDILTRSSTTSTQSSQSNNVPQTSKNVERGNFDFSLCDANTSYSSNSSNNNGNLNNNNQAFTHDFTKSVKMMESLNNLYSGYNAEKKVDPLDQLFNQYNFNSGNNMRSFKPQQQQFNHNLNNNYQMNNVNNVPYNNGFQYNNNSGCMYGINGMNMNVNSNMNMNMNSQLKY